MHHFDKLYDLATELDVFISDHALKRFRQDPCTETCTQTGICTLSDFETENDLLVSNQFNKLTSSEYPTLIHPLVGLDCMLINVKDGLRGFYLTFMDPFVNGRRDSPDARVLCCDFLKGGPNIYTIGLTSSIASVITQPYEKTIKSINWIYGDRTVNKVC